MRIATAAEVLHHGLTVEEDYAAFFDGKTFAQAWDGLTNYQRDHLARWLDMHAPITADSPIEAIEAAWNKEFGNPCHYCTLPKGTVWPKSTP